MADVWWKPEDKSGQNLAWIHEIYMMTLDGVDVSFDEDSIAGYQQNCPKLARERPGLHYNVMQILLNKPMTSFPMRLEGLTPDELELLVNAQIVYTGPGTDPDGTKHAKVPMISRETAAAVKCAYRWGASRPFAVSRA